jgi:HEPN domain-containing protein
VSLAVHGLESVTQAIHQGSRFYSVVCQYGIQLYAKNGLRLDLPYHQMNPATTLDKGSKNYHHCYGLALGFWDSAGSSYEAQNYAICVFLLHQTVEHACKALIKLFTAYRCEMHNLSRLLDLCLIFSDKLSDALPRKTDEDRRLFALLRNSYREARYKDDYKVCESDADTLLTRVKDLLDATELLGLARITEYEKKAAEATAEINVQTDINTQLPYAE